MSTRFVDVLKECEGLYTLHGVSDDEIREAQNRLNLTFAAEYYEYLKEFGIASVRGHEFTGLGSSKRLSVVDNTLQERALHVGRLDQFYVVEQCSVDGLIIVQAPDGKVYEAGPGMGVKLIAGGLGEYLMRE